MTKGKIVIPLYDIGAVVSGFYIGYNEGKGIYTSQTIEYLTKYGPTVFAVCTTPAIIKLNNMLGRWMNRKVIQGIQDGNLEIITKEHAKKYKSLNDSEKEELTLKISGKIHNLESKLENPKYIKPMLISGTRTAIGTIIGYTAGRIYSQIN